MGWHWCTEHTQQALRLSNSPTVWFNAFQWLAGVVVVSGLALGTSAPLVQRGSLLALFSSLWKLNIENRRAGSGHTCTHACVLLLPQASAHFLQSVPIRAAQNSERKFPEVGANENLLAVSSPYKVAFRVPWLLIIWAFPFPFPLHSALLQTLLGL